MSKKPAKILVMAQNVDAHWMTDGTTELRTLDDLFKFAVGKIRIGDKYLIRIEGPYETSARSSTAPRPQRHSPPGSTARTQRPPAGRGGATRPRGGRRAPTSS